MMLYKYCEYLYKQYMKIILNILNYTIYKCKKDKI